MHDELKESLVGIVYLELEVSASLCFDLTCFWMNDFNLDFFIKIYLESLFQNYFSENV